MAVAVDQAIARQDATAAPSSRWWPVFGLLQSANQVVIALVVAWLVVWFVVRPQLPDVVLPVVGPVPTPLVLLGAALLVGYLLARLLSLHAGWLGRRWAQRLGGDLRRDVEENLAETAFAHVERLEAARAAVGAAWQRARDAAANGVAQHAGASLRDRVASRLPGRDRARSRGEPPSRS
jgi:hypothetical protein